MALIKCIECNKDISDQAVACPHCGVPVNQYANFKTEHLTNKLKINVKSFPLFLAILSVILSPALIYAIQIFSDTSFDGRYLISILLILFFLIEPGIFLFQTLLGITKNKRGNAYAITWLVISSVVLLFNLIITYNSKDIVATFQSGINIIESIPFMTFASVFRISAMILFLVQLKTDNEKTELLIKKPWFVLCVSFILLVICFLLYAVSFESIV